MDGPGSKSRSKYRISPLAQYDRALETASALLALQVSPTAINFELRREYDLSVGQAAAMIRTALAATSEEPAALVGGRNSY